MGQQSTITVLHQILPVCPARHLVSPHGGALLKMLCYVVVCFIFSLSLSLKVLLICFSFASSTADHHRHQTLLFLSSIARANQLINYVSAARLPSPLPSRTSYIFHRFLLFHFPSLPPLHSPPFTYAPPGHHHSRSVQIRRMEAR